MIAISHPQRPEVPSDPAALRIMDEALAGIEHIAPAEIKAVRRVVTGNPSNTREHRVAAWQYVWASVADEFNPRTSLAKSAALEACHRRVAEVLRLSKAALAKYEETRA